MADARIIIRKARPSDGEAVAAIFGHHVLHGTASYETAPPSGEAMRARIEDILTRNWPFLAAECDQEVVGYAYATQFRDRPAYRHAAEDSIYIAPGYLRRGIGRALLTNLCLDAERAGFRQMVAVVGGGDPASIALHEACGFKLVGRLHAVGWKHGRWLDSVYLQRPLGDGGSLPPE